MVEKFNLNLLKTNHDLKISEKSGKYSDIWDENFVMERDCSDPYSKQTVIAEKFMVSKSVFMINV